jgi:hypothetical protein
VYWTILILALIPLLFIAGIPYTKLMISDASVSCPKEAKQNVYRLMDNPIEQVLVFQFGKLAITGENPRGKVFLTGYTALGIPLTKFTTNCDGMREVSRD